MASTAGDRLEAGRAAEPATGARWQSRSAGSKGRDAFFIGRRHRPVDDPHLMWETTRRVGRPISSGGDPRRLFPRRARGYELPRLVEPELDLSFKCKRFSHTPIIVTGDSPRSQYFPAGVVRELLADDLVAATAPR
jgi:hypothetical protein